MDSTLNALFVHRTGPLLLNDAGDLNAAVTLIYQEVVRAGGAMADAAAIRLLTLALLEFAMGHVKKTRSVLAQDVQFTGALASAGLAARLAFTHVMAAAHLVG